MIGTPLPVTNGPRDGHDARRHRRGAGLALDDESPVAPGRMEQVVHAVHGCRGPRGTARIATLTDAASVLARSCLPPKGGVHGRLSDSLPKSPLVAIGARPTFALAFFNVNQGSRCHLVPTPIELLLDPVSLTVFAMYAALILWEALAPARPLPPPGGGWR